MIFGGTNWGNLGHPGGNIRDSQNKNLVIGLTLKDYSSYDYAASVTENREIYREKYSELKLEANFLKVSPAYLTASAHDGTNNTFTSTTSITTVQLTGNGSSTNFYVVRHSDYQQETSTTYNLRLPTSKGTLNIPQLGGSLTLSGRDSKWHVTDYSVGKYTLLYSTAEIFTWKKFADKTVLVVYGGPGELHELAILSSSSARTVEGSGVSTKTTDGATILNWQTSATRRVVRVEELFIYILDRNTAYNFWVPDFARTDTGLFTRTVEETASVIVEAGYLVRSVSIEGTSLHIKGDLNSTASIKVIGAPRSTKSLYFNGQMLSIKTNPVTGEWTSTLQYSAPVLDLPELSSLAWKYLDNLPEIQPSYDDSLWTVANQTTTNNPRQLQTPTSLYGSDYGYNTGALIYRGRFTAIGTESSLYVATQGGSGFGSSVWLNDTHIGSWPGNDRSSYHGENYSLPSLKAGKPYVITIVIDNNGLDENWVVGSDGAKDPRGILNYGIANRLQSAITWKLTGNLGGEKYVDKARGPLNEGGLYAERQGFHQPNPPNQKWAAGSPMTGINSAGIAFYQASFDLSIPSGFDVPLSFYFGNTTINGATAEYQAQLWVNGYLTSFSLRSWWTTFNLSINTLLSIH